MSIEILKPSLLSTLVGENRVGFRRLGIGPAGAIDQFAVKLANYLVGNDNEPVIEFGHSSAEVLFHEGGVVCVTGAGFEIQVDEKIIPLWKPFKVKSNTILKLTKTSSGTWSYLAINGGWQASEWLGSKTTSLSAKAGGHEGRILRKHDTINAATTLHVDETKVLPWGVSSTEVNEIYQPANHIRCIASVESNLLSAASREKFISGEFVISNQSNRMGYRMGGPVLSLNEQIELVSSPVDFGTVQMVPSGNLIVLMADHQTTGGYPRIASVIKADLPKLAQLMPGAKINFKMISMSEAEAVWDLRNQKLTDLKRICIDRFKKYFSV